MMAAHEFMNYRNWVVCGTVSREEKFASRILHALRDNGFQAVGFHPIPAVEPEAYHHFEDLPTTPEVLDLVIRPELGLDVVKAAHRAGINRVMIQPGARSEEIRQWCRDNGMEYFEGCALVELTKMDR